MPRWQLAHCVLSVNLLCSRAPVHTVEMVWQASQLAAADAVTVACGMCVTERPSAGGKPPVWQVEHWAATGTWVWFHFDGRQTTVPWHEKQFVAPTGTWFRALPVAPVPPVWQLAQFVAAVNVLWLILAPSQVSVEVWQVSHAAFVVTWVVDLPTAGGYCPVWQLVQLLAIVRLACTLAEVFHATVPPLWQVSQFATAPPSAA